MIPSNLQESIKEEEARQVSKPKPQTGYKKRRRRAQLRRNRQLVTSETLNFRDFPKPMSPFGSKVTYETIAGLDMFSEDPNKKYRKVRINK